MARIFFWMGVPDVSIPETVWSEFLYGMAIWMIVTTAVAALLAVTFYAWSARRRKIRFPSDLFKGYTPLLWLALAVPAGVFIVLACVLQYPAALSTDIGKYSVALQMGAYTFVATAALAYLPIVLISRITPEKYVYRRLLYRSRKK